MDVVTGWKVLKLNSEKVLKIKHSFFTENSFNQLLLAFPC